MGRGVRDHQALPRSGPRRWRAADSYLPSGGDADRPAAAHGRETRERQASPLLVFRHDPWDSAISHTAGWKRTECWWGPAEPAAAASSHPVHVAEYAGVAVASANGSSSPGEYRVCAPTLQRCGVTERSNSVPGDLPNARLPCAGAIASIVDSQQAFCTLTTAVNGDARFAG